MTLSALAVDASVDSLGVLELRWQFTVVLNGRKWSGLCISTPASTGHWLLATLVEHSLGQDSSPQLRAIPQKLISCELSSDNIASARGWLC